MKKIFFGVVSLAVLGLGGWVLFLRTPAPRTQGSETFVGDASLENRTYKPFVIEVVPPPAELAKLPGTLTGTFVASEVGTNIAGIDTPSLTRDFANSFTGQKKGKSYVFNVELAQPATKKAMIFLNIPNALLYPTLIDATQIEKGRAEIPLLAFRPNTKQIQCSGKSDVVKFNLKIPQKNRSSISSNLRYVVGIFTSPTPPEGKLPRVKILETHQIFKGSELAGGKEGAVAKLDLSSPKISAPFFRAFNCPGNFSIDDCFSIFRGFGFEFDRKSQPLLMPVEFGGSIPSHVCGGDTLDFKLVFWNSERDPASKVFED